MSLGISQAEQFKLRIGNRTLGLANFGCDLGKLVRQSLELSLQDSAFCARVHISKSCIGMRVDILLDTANAAIKIFCLTAISSIQSIIFISSIFVLEINCVEKNLLFANFLSQLI